MSKKDFTWPEAKKRCRLNQNDIEMAKRLGFAPGALIRSIPGPKQKWRLPVKCWIHQLHEKKFGHVLGEKQLEFNAPPPLAPKDETDEARRFEEEMFWEDYYDRNADGETTGDRSVGQDSTNSVRWDAGPVDDLDLDLPF